ncbi:MAG TPA: MraY family glycosyltransferase, partial [Tichowtungia sp.]|nr:MraY family glycosyltransferase [Tichowtungia sp.]
LLGLADDRVGMRPWVKLLGQVALGVAAYLLNIRIQNVLGLNLPEMIDFLGTVLWFVAIMNAFNLIDGIDGLAAGIALIAAVGIGISLFFRRLPGDVLLFAGFAGACLGFLRYNYFPAAVFLGDTGSLFIGFTLAAMTISTSSKGPGIAAIGMPLLAIGVPLFDSALAVWRRSVRRMLQQEDDTGDRAAIGRGDAEHLHHRLLHRFGRHDQVAWRMYAATIFFAAVGILSVLFNDKAVGILMIAFVVTAYTVVRHLVSIELKDSGEMVLRGLARPVRRNQMVLFYILSDLLILNLTWLTVTVLFGLYDGVETFDLKRIWLYSLPIDVALPFMCLVLFRVYSRAWVFAGIADYAALAAASVCGGLLAAACTLLFMPSDDNLWRVFLQMLLYIPLAFFFMAATRIFLRVVKTLMAHSVLIGRAGGKSHQP